MKQPTPTGWITTRLDSLSKTGVIAFTEQGPEQRNSTTILKSGAFRMVTRECQWVNSARFSQRSSFKRRRSTVFPAGLVFSLGLLRNKDGTITAACPVHATPANPPSILRQFENAHS